MVQSILLASSFSWYPIKWNVTKENTVITYIRAQEMTILSAKVHGYVCMNECNFKTILMDNLMVGHNSGTLNYENWYSYEWRR